jgi:hypothetical protein
MLTKMYGGAWFSSSFRQADSLDAMGLTAMPPGSERPSEMDMLGGGPSYSNQSAYLFAQQSMGADNLVGLGLGLDGGGAAADGGPAANMLQHDPVLHSMQWAATASVMPMQYDGTYQQPSMVPQTSASGGGRNGHEGP